MFKSNTETVSNQGDKASVTVKISVSNSQGSMLETLNVFEVRKELDLYHGYTCMLCFLLRISIYSHA